MPFTRYIFFLFFFLPWFFFGMTERVFACEIHMMQDDIVFRPSALIKDQLTHVYVSITSLCNEDTEGSVVFMVDGESIGTKAFSLRANGKPEEVWITWTPHDYAKHMFGVMIRSDQAVLTDTITREIFVDRDTDQDGTPDQRDADNDNDGVLDVDEIKQKTDPWRPDTDGDGVDDKTDVFPIDMKRSTLETASSTPLPKPNNGVAVIVPSGHINSPSSSVPKKRAAPLPSLSVSFMPFMESSPQTSTVYAVVATSSLFEKVNKDWYPTKISGANVYSPLWGLFGMSISVSGFFFWKSRQDPLL